MPNTPALKMHWKANFSDNTCTYQFDPKEHPFKEVLDKKDLLTSFTLYNPSSSFSLTVDMIEGTIKNSNHSSTIEELKVPKKHLRLIYFRRNTITMNQKGDTLDHQVVYILGYQYLNRQGHNCKVLVQIDEDENVVMGDVQ